MKKPTTLPNIHRIRRASRLFIRILQFLMILVPLADLTIWVFANNLIAPVLATTLPAYVQLPLPLSARLLAFCVSLVPLSLFIFANATLIRLFRLYENGLIFNADNVRCFRYLSRALMAWCLVGVLIDPMMSIALTLHRPEGQRMLSIGLGSPDLTALLIGGILAVITWVMDEARELKEVQELTI